MTDFDVHPEEVASSYPPETLNTDQRVAYELMVGICGAMEGEVEPVVRSVQGSHLHVELVGSQIAATWGRSGPALDALQFLANMILSRNRGMDVRLMLDADNYRARRAEALTARAIELAREVKARNEEAELEPLPAHERRIIHSALADDPDVSTYSEGDEPGRHVVISPRR